MGLRERVGLPATPVAAPRPFPNALERQAWIGKPPVQSSDDLNRIIGLPRRDLAAAYTQVDFAALEARLRLPPNEVKCVCKTFDPPRQCPEHLKEDQTRALLEAEAHGGLFAAMGVGKGKTLVDFLLPFVMRSKVAVLLIPAALVDKFLNVDARYYGGHWKLPNIVSQTPTLAVGGGLFIPGRPALHVMSYERLSRQEGTDLLMRIKPDLLILDEAHKVKNPKGPRKMRIQRCIDALKPRVAILSGTIASRGIADAAHLAAWALGDGSPFPRKHQVVEEWALALDPVVNDESPAAAPGALARLEMIPGFEIYVRDDELKLGRAHEANERTRLAFRLRRNETRGVVATTSSSFEGSLLIRKRVPAMPDAIRPLIETAKKGKRPDGEEADEKMLGFAWARQLSLGFFHRWRFPRGEPEELIKRWRDARKEWHRAVRKRLENPRAHFDTPGLLKNAVRRWHEGGCVDCHRGPREKHASSCKIADERPLWAPAEWPAWAEVEDLVHHVPSTVWLDKGCPELAPIPGADFMVRDAVDWIEKEGPGVVWAEAPELGERIARAAGVPWYGEGKQAGIDIQRETGKRSVVASMHAHRDGKDLQYAFHRCYFTSPYADGGYWEQAIGRFHRQGQREDTVIVDIAMHTPDFENSFSKARERARFVAQTDGQDQKLLIADYEWT